jgi:dienelactone hydrolase
MLLPRWYAFPIVMVLSQLVSGCGESDLANTTTTARFADPGPYPVAVHRLDMGDRELEVWYPARPGSEQGSAPAGYRAVEFLPDAILGILPQELKDLVVEMPAYRDLPISDDGPFPVMTFSHGAGGFRLAYSALLAGIASHGIVVASIDHIEWGLLAFVGLPPSSQRDTDELVLTTLALLASENNDPQSPLADGVDITRVATAGHSAGGRAAFALLDRPEIKSAIGYATVGNPAEANGKPILYMVGALDELITGLEQSYAQLPPTKRLVSVLNAGHNSFTDQCAIIHGGNNIIELVRAAGLPLPDDLAELALDGCRHENLAPAEFWRVIQHFTVAHLRAVFGIDPRPVDLEPTVVDAFAPVEVRYLTEE